MVRRITKAVNDSDPDFDNDDERFDEEPSLLSVWVAQSPSMIVSMVVHLAIVLMLALCVMHAAPKDDHQVKVFPELDDDPVENVDLKKTIVPEPLDNPQPVDTPPAETIPELASDSAPDITPFDDPTLEAPEVEFDPAARSEVVVGKSKNPLGNASTGLGNRDPGKRGGPERRWGPPTPTGPSVELALGWLARHQNGDGSWSFDHTPGDNCSLFPDPGQKSSKMGATGLALLAFLGRGHTHQNSSSPHRQVVHKGVSYLIKHMAVSGDAGRLYEADGEPHSHMYCHGIATCALAEAFGMTNDPKLRNPAQYALNYIVNAQNADGGWRYQPGDPGDTSALGWQLMAFKSGKMAYLNVPDHVYPKAGKFLDAVQANGGAEYSYMTTGHHGATQATSAIGLLCRVYLGWKQDHLGLERGSQLVGQAGPHPSNMYFNYYATMFMFQHAKNRHDPAWRGWNEPMVKHLVDTQEKRGGIHRIGSWHFPGAGLEEGLSDVGGRLYNTAMAAMTLQVVYRYEREYDRKDKSI